MIENINPSLDLESLKAAYQADQRVRIDQFLEPKFAAQVADCLNTSLKYDYIFFSQDQNHVASEEQMGVMDMHARQELQTELISLASQGIGFLYGGFKMEGTKIPEAPPVLQKLNEVMNSAELLELVMSITDSIELKSSSVQYTRYTPGNYLTRHRDDVETEGRRLAFVLGMSPQWHPDWGGLLQFFEDSGVPKDAWEPRFNSLSLFDVRHVHSVTYVTPHAIAPRYAMTGWFRNRV